MSLKSAKQIRDPNILFRLRFPLLCFLLLILMGAHVIGRAWTGDFWTHAAVVRELALHPWTPVNPFFAVDEPFPFFSPYAVCIGLFSRVAHLDAIDSLAVAGLVNLLLLFASLRLFVRAFLKSTSSNADTNSVCFYFLLLTLFFWGSRPLWGASGFYHFDVFRFIISYPSFGMLWVCFLCFYLYLRIIQGGNRLLFVLLSLLCAIVPLSHPFTSGFLFVGLFSLMIGIPASNQRRAQLALSLAGSAILMTAWPYFSFWKLVLRESKWFLGFYHGDIYNNLMARVFPSLIAVPILFGRWKTNRRDPLLIASLLLAALCLYGYLTDRWVLGRLISHTILILHLVLAVWVGEIETQLSGDLPVPAWKRFSFGTIILALVISIWSFRDGISRHFTDRPNYEKYLFLTQYTGQYDTVLTDVQTGFIEPAFGGKIIALNAKPALSEKYGPRWKDADSFFTRDFPAAERLNILQRYRVDFVLLNGEQIRHEKEILQSIESYGRIVYQDSDHHLTLFRIDRLP